MPMQNSALRSAQATPLSAFLEPLPADTRWDDLVLADPARTQLHQLARAVQARRLRVTPTRKAPGITVLFCGASGAGKTFTVAALANRLHCCAYRIDIDQVVSPYVGETERNLQRLFTAGGQGGWILVIDAIDVLFDPRTAARDPQGRYANLDMNDLLRRIEGYNGLVILTANRRADLHAEFLRRVRLVIEFPPPGAAERRRIWQRALAARANSSEFDFEHLSSLDLSGGAIASVAADAARRALEADAALTMTIILEVARAELLQNSRPGERRR